METIAWCVDRASDRDPEGSLRSEALKPQSVLRTTIELARPPLAVPNMLRTASPVQQREYIQHQLTRRRHEDTKVVAQRQAIINSVADRRRELLRVVGISPNVTMPRLAGGQLLLYNPDDSLADGAAEDHSLGFFDVDNVPPWDTWIDYVVESVEQWKSYLVSWVPPQLVPLADAGIQYNPEHCIAWAAHFHADFVLELQRLGIVE